MAIHTSDLFAMKLNDGCSLWMGKPLTNQSLVGRINHHLLTLLASYIQNQLRLSGMDEIDAAVEIVSAFL